MTEMEENTESKFEEIINAALKRAWRIINGFEKISDEDEKILEAYKKKADEECKVEDTELTQWERDMEEIARDDRDIRSYDLQLLKEGYEWYEELKKYL